MYYQTALTQAIQHQDIIPTKQEPGILTRVKLNYHELICIEIALIGLKDLVCQNWKEALPEALQKFTIEQLKAQLRYLMDWLNKPMLKEQLRLDGNNTVWWPFTSSELVDWLLNICQSCINSDAIFVKACDSASIEYADFESLCLEHEEKLNYPLADDMEYSAISGWQDHYNYIVNAAETSLVRKLKAIQSQGYPLYPIFSLIN